MNLPMWLSQSPAPYMRVMEKPHTVPLRLPYRDLVSPCQATFARDTCILILTLTISVTAIKATAQGNYARNLARAIGLSSILA